MKSYLFNKNSDYSAKYIALSVVILLATCVVGGYAVDALLQVLPIDFPEYWSAIQVFTQGGNPYSPESLLAFQRKLDPSLQVPVMMWNPPWVLSYLNIFIVESFRQSCIIWLMYCVLLIIASGLIIKVIFRKKNVLGLLAMFLTFFSLPLSYSALYGQLGAHFLFASVLLYYSIVSRSTIAATVGLFLLSFKPHLFLPIFPAIVVILTRVKLQWSILRAVILTIFFMLLSILINEGVYTYWREAVSSIELPLVPSIYQWVTSSPVDLFKRGCHSAGQIVALKSSFAIIGGYLAYKISTYCVRLRQEYLFAALIPFSSFFTPYGWIFDYTIFSVTYCAMLHSYAEGKSSSKCFFLIFTSLQIPLLYNFMSVDTPLSDFVWYPLVATVISMLWLSSLLDTAKTTAVHVCCSK